MPARTGFRRGPLVPLVGADVGIGPYGVRSEVGHPTRGCGSGGHKGRPYRPAPGLPVGAGFMPARTGFRRGPLVPLVGADVGIGPYG